MVHQRPFKLTWKYSLTFLPYIVESSWHFCQDCNTWGIFSQSDYGSTGTWCEPLSDKMFCLGLGISPFSWTGQWADRVTSRGRTWAEYVVTTMGKRKTKWEGLSVLSEGGVVDSGRSLGRRLRVGVSTIEWTQRWRASRVVVGLCLVVWLCGKMGGVGRIPVVVTETLSSKKVNYSGVRWVSVETEGWRDTGRLTRNLTENVDVFRPISSHMYCCKDVFVLFLIHVCVVFKYSSIEV